MRHDPRPGGAAPPDDGAPSLRIESREQLVFLLMQAAELEHGLMCEYLFAQWTLKRSTDEGVTAERLESIERWRRDIGEADGGAHRGTRLRGVTALAGRPGRCGGQAPGHRRGSARRLARVRPFRLSGRSVAARGGAFLLAIAASGPVSQQVRRPASWLPAEPRASPPFLPG